MFCAIFPSQFARSHLTQTISHRHGSHWSVHRISYEVAVDKRTKTHEMKQMMTMLLQLHLHYEVDLPGGAEVARVEEVNERELHVAVVVNGEEQTLSSLMIEEQHANTTP
jgi:O-phosphoseryl-tRNA(Cys) synthetase